MISSAAGNKVNYCASSAPLNFRFQGGIGYRILIPVLKTGLVPPKRSKISNYALNDKNVYFVYFLLFSQTGLSLLYQEINECQYIQTLRVSKSISYPTSNIEYLDFDLLSVFLPKILQKYSENSKKSPEIRKLSGNSETSLKIKKILRKFRKFSENSENSPQIQKIRRNF